MEKYDLKDWLEITYYLIAVFGIPIALWKYITSKQKEQVENDDKAYDALDEKYLDFLDLCLENPELNVFDIPDSQKTELSPIQQKKELILFTRLFSIFERAYRMLHNTGKNEKMISQWEDWKGYMKMFSQRENCQQAWKRSKDTFNEEFQEYFGGLVLSWEKENKQKSEKQI
jgi:hypothetical protein